MSRRKVECFPRCRCSIFKVGAAQRKRVLTVGLKFGVLLKKSSSFWTKPDKITAGLTYLV